MGERMLNPSHLPNDPVTTWDRDTLIHKWVEAYSRYKKYDGGALRLMSVNAIHDELVDRGIDPAEPLKRYGYEVSSVEVAEP